jgi:tRNA(Arg) A34 adenosine deaminase TadA
MPRASKPAGPDDAPVGAVILDEAGAIVAQARNRREIDRDPTAPAEIVATRTLGSWRLAGLTLVVTLESCTMCVGAVTMARFAQSGLRAKTRRRARSVRCGTWSGTAASTTGRRLSAGACCRRPRSLPPNAGRSGNHHGGVA